MTALAMTTFDAGGRTLSYACDGSGPTVVCVPGGPGFDPIAYYAGLRLPGFSRLVFAPRGTGASTAPPTPDGYRIAGYVEDLEALRMHLGTKRMTVFGASHGGSAVIAYAAAFPDAVDRLVVCSPPTRMDAEFTRQVAAARDRFALAAWDGAERLEAAEAAAVALRGDLPDPDRRRQLRVMLSRYVAHQGPAQSRYLDGLCAAPLNSAATAGAFAEMGADFDLLAGTDRITVPALVVSGALDVVIPPAASRVLADALPDGRYVEIPDAGHFAEVDAPEMFDAHVMTFLAGPQRL